MFGPSKKELLARIEALERKLGPITEPEHAWGYRVTAQDLVNDFLGRFEPIDEKPKEWKPYAAK